MSARVFLFLAFTMVATACGPRFHAMTTPPPGRSAELNEKQKFWGGWKYDVRITAGTVLAVGCDCKRLNVTTDDARVAAVMKAHATTTNAATQRENRVPGFVVVGIKPGRTQVRVKASNGKKVIRVLVEPAMTPRPTVTKAAAK